MDRQVWEGGDGLALLGGGAVMGWTSTVNMWNNFLFRLW